MRRLLVIDDSPAIVQTYREIFEQEKFEVTSSDDPELSLALVTSFEPDIILLDIDLKGDGINRDGVAILTKIRQNKSKEALPIIVISGVGDTNLLIELMQQGANDFEVKPVDDYRSLLEKINRLIKLKPERKRTAKPVAADLIVGKSRLMMNLTKTIYSLAQSECDTLILGETGTGKDLVARVYHRLSPRQHKPFYLIDCTKISSSIFEAELFGYVPGAFSDAKQLKKGLIEQADGGIAFLNEIGDMPLEQQAKLLTLLETKSITRVGSTQPIKLDIVIVAATNQELKNMVEEGRFRKDLYYRLFNHVIINPPLRDHLEDLPLMVDHFIKEFNHRYQRQVQSCTPELLQQWMNLKWDGNVRELRKAVETGVMNAIDHQIQVSDVQLLLDQQQGKTSASAPLPDSTLDWNQDYNALKQTLKKVSDQQEREYILYHLNKQQYHKGKTAAAIGINNYQQLNQIMKRLNID